MSMPAIGLGWDFSGLPELTEEERLALLDNLRGITGSGGGGGGGGVQPSVTYRGSGRSRIRVLTYPDGRVEEIPDPDTSFENQQRELQRRDARQTVRQVIASYGIEESLADYLFDLIAKDEINLSDEGSIIFAMRSRPEYQRRFAGNAKRVAAGFEELDPSSYLQLERAYRETLASNGMPANFYDDKDDFADLIGGNVSVSELNERLQYGYRAVADADPAVKAQMYRLYGITESELAAYFIDPNRARPLLSAADYRRQARAAQIAARGQEQAGISLTGDLAEDLARRGITEEEAYRGFEEIGLLGELRQQFGGEEAITEQEFVQQQFGVDINARERLRRRRQGRVAAFEGGGAFSSTVGATQFSRETGAGRAQ